MYKLLAVAAALLLGQFIITNVATAAENPEYLDKDTVDSHKQKKSKKIIKMLQSAGIYDTTIAHLVNTVDANTQDGQLMLYKNRIADGNITLRYDFSPAEGEKKLGLFYKPDNSNYEYRMHTNSVNVTYKFKF